jgi:WD40 repeat protein
VLLYEVKNQKGNLVQKLSGHKTTLSCILPINKNLLMSGDGMGTVRIFDLEKGKECNFLKSHSEWVMVNLLH